jgi:hypothetical protein
MAQVKDLKLVGKLQDGEAEARVSLADGSTSIFPVALPTQPAAWVKTGYHFGPPTLFVARADERSVRDAVDAMAACMGGFWLRYYNARKKVPKVTHKVASLALERREPASDAPACSAVAEVALADGRIFSILCSTPARFESLLTENSLPFFFGPSALFVKEMALPIVKKAVTAMAADADRWLCRYDTPRTTLPDVLAAFTANRS